MKETFKEILLKLNAQTNKTGTFFAKDFNLTPSVFLTMLLDMEKEKFIEPVHDPIFGETFKRLTYDETTAFAMIMADDGIKWLNNLPANVTVAHGTCQDTNQLPDSKQPD